MTDLDLFLQSSEFPTLQTERLILRELREDDLLEAHRLFTDPEVMRYVGKSPHDNTEETRDFLRRSHDVFPSHEGVRWAITRRGTDRLIGSCGHWRLLKPHFRSEIGYDLLPEQWGQGLMAEALHAILHFGFTRMGLHSVEAQIDPPNLRSRRVLERLGFLQDGLLRANFFFAGHFTDTAIFTLLRHELQSVHSR